MNIKNDPEFTAYETCRILKDAFPYLEIAVHDPEDFFDGFFVDSGFPAAPDYYPVWQEPGWVICIESPGIYWWDEDNLSFVASEYQEGSVGMAVIFLHCDGDVSVVDESNGKLHQLFLIPKPEVLAEFLKLFFDEGRSLLAKGAESEASIVGINVPFFQFPDDYSADYSTMPSVPAADVIDAIRLHVESGASWLSSMADVWLRSRVKSEGDGFLDIDWQGDCDETAETKRGESRSSVLSFLENEQARREKERLVLIQIARGLPAEAFTSPPSYVHLSEEMIAWRHIGGEFPKNLSGLPVLICYSDAVFGPYMNYRNNPTGASRAFNQATSYLIDNSRVQFPVPLDIPAYPEQVENAFCQMVLLHQGPLVVEREMRIDANAEPEIDARRCLERRRDILRRIRGRSL